MDLDGLSTTAGAAAPTGPNMHKPPTDKVKEGAEYDTKTEDATGASESAAAAAARVRPPRPADWVAMTKAQRESWRKHASRKVKRESDGRTGS